MPKKGENIYKRKDGRWEGRYIRYYDPDGKAKFGYLYGRSYTEVKQKLIQAKGSIGGPDPCMGGCAYGTILDEWLNLARTRVKESTFACYTRIINGHIRPQLGACPISAITTQRVECFLSEKLTAGNLVSGGGLSPKTVSDILVVIKSSLDYARGHGHEVPCDLSKVTLKRSQTEIRVLSHTEQKKLVDTLLQEMDLSKFGVLLSLYTGVRIGELCSLKWGDISPCGSVLKVRKTLQRVQNTDACRSGKTKVIITNPKSPCSRRDIPIPSFLAAYIPQFRADPDVYILSGVKDRYVEPRTMQNRFKRYMKDSGNEPVGFHTLRHTFATRCVEVGFEIKSLSEILGHASVHITLNRYVHSSFDLKVSNMNKLSLEL